MKEVGEMTNKMDSELRVGKMDQVMKDNSSKEKNMAKVFRINFNQRKIYLERRRCLHWRLV